jgi:RNA polymerase sigma factor (sigma-70 family)
MAAIRLATVMRHIYRLAVPPVEGERADAQLLDRFSRGDGEALEILVRRHGPLVWRVCRRVVGRDDRAEDAFQATFLVLAQKARSIKKPASLASWLHGVAYRISRRARTNFGGDVVAVEEVLEAEAADPSRQAAWRELGRIVEEEVSALPEKLRAPILLCYWEGKTNDEAAGQLGLPCGTLKTRLGRARELLQQRLTRRGVTLPAGVIAVMLAPGAAEAALPPLLAAATSRAMAQISAGQLATGFGGSAGASSLAKAALRGIVIGQMKTCLLLTLAAALVAIAAGSFAWQAKPNALQQPEDQIESPRAVRNVATIEPPAPDKQRTDNFGDPLPAGALLRLGTLRHRLLNQFFFHTEFLPDGKTALTANFEEVRWVDIASGRLLKSWPLPKGSTVAGLEQGITVAGFSPDGRLVLLGDDKGVHLWDLTSRKWLCERGARISARFAADGKVVAVKYTSPVRRRVTSFRCWPKAPRKPA